MRKIEPPIFEGTEKEKVKQILEFVRGKIKHGKWTQKEVMAKSGQRTPAEIIESGNVCYILPCLDTSVVVSELFKVNKIQHRLRYDQIQTEMLGGSIAFSVEFKINNEWHTLITDPLKMEVIKGLNPKKWERDFRIGRTTHKKNMQLLERLEINNGSKTNSKLHKKGFEIFGLGSKEKFLELAGVQSEADFIKRVIPKSGKTTGKTHKVKLHHPF